MPDRITSLCIVPGMEPHKLLKALMDRDGHTPTSLANAINSAKVTQPQVYKYVNGGIVQPGTAFLLPIARHFGVPLEAFANAAAASACYLKLFAPDQEQTEKANLVSLESGKPQHENSSASFTNDRRAPVIAWARLGVDLQITNDEIATEERIAVPGDASERCKWVVVDADAPSFGIKKGYRVAIDPDVRGHRPVSGEIYLFETDGGEHLLARYRPLTGQNFEAIPHEGPPLERDRHGLTLLGIHMGTWKGRP